ncbi:Uncharacterised protein [Mycobacteroides abscessus subsp. abscessus]|nr:Uncharacterised protein [Mycobacteroides abscessus subsp. abscessus]
MRFEFQSSHVSPGEAVLTVYSAVLGYRVAADRARGPPLVSRMACTTITATQGRTGGRCPNRTAVHLCALLGFRQRKSVVVYCGSVVSALPTSLMAM